MIGGALFVASCGGGEKTEETAATTDSVATEEMAPATTDSAATTDTAAAATTDTAASAQ